MSTYLPPVLAGVVLALLQLLAAVPWLAVLDPAAFRAALRKPATWLGSLVVVGGVGALLALVVSVMVQDPTRLLGWGRLYGAILNAQLVVDFFAIVFPLMLLVWPQGGAVALAAFREGVRQPMYWLISIVAVGVLVISPFLPYFTFGEDFKMVSQLGFDIIMLSAVVFSVLAASMSISEEIEGRTAITLMSKPVSRRQFLLGKFFGILLAALLMTGLIGVI